MKLLLLGLLYAHGFPWLSRPENGPWTEDSARWSRSARSMGKPWWGLPARICPVLQSVKNYTAIYSAQCQSFKCGWMYLCWWCWQNLLRWHIMHMQNWPIIYFMPESRLGIDVLWPRVCIQTRPYSPEYSRHLPATILQSQEKWTMYNMGYGNWILEHVFQLM